MIRFQNIVVACGFLIAAPAWAHHGKDFLIVESYDVPHPGDTYLLASARYANAGEGDSWELEPALLIGAFPRVAAEVHAHFVQEEDARSLKYEAVAPSLHVQLTDPASTFPIQIGVAVEYEIASDGAPDVFEGRFIVEKGFGDAKLSLNIVAEHAVGQDTEIGYAAGVRANLSSMIAIGLEGEGSFETRGPDEALIGVYFEPAERFTLKLGAGTGFGSDSLDVAARIGGVYRF